MQLVLNKDTPLIPGFGTKKPTNKQTKDTPSMRTKQLEGHDRGGCRGEVPVEEQPGQAPPCVCGNKGFEPRFSLYVSL